MKPVFADTGFFLALINPRDQYHRSARELNSGLTVPLITTAWVLLELANAISASVSRRQFEQVLTRLRSESDATIIDPTPELFELGCRFYICTSGQEVVADGLHLVHSDGTRIYDGCTYCRPTFRAGWFPYAAADMNVPSIKNPHDGSTLDDFLRVEAVEAAALKRAVALKVADLKEALARCHDAGA
jgi:hypothetical protein